MNPDVYICYSSSDKVAADAICHVLEENKFKCWIKPRDVGIEHVADVIPQAIRDSRCVVLVFSENAKASNFVNTEVDIAFSSNIPIIVFKIDDSHLDGGLEFFLENKHWLDAYPNPSVEFRRLVIDVAKLLDKPISDPVITSPESNSFGGKKSNNGRGNYILRIFLSMCILPFILVFIGATITSITQEYFIGEFLMFIAIGLFIVSIIYAIGRLILNIV